MASAAAMARTTYILLITAGHGRLLHAVLALPRRYSGTGRPQTLRSARPVSKGQLRSLEPSPQSGYPPSEVYAHV